MTIDDCWKCEGCGEVLPTGKENCRCLETGRPGMRMIRWQPAARSKGSLEQNGAIAAIETDQGAERKREWWEDPSVRRRYWDER